MGLGAVENVDERVDCMSWKGKYLDALEIVKNYRNMNRDLREEFGEWDIVLEQIHSLSGKNSCINMCPCDLCRFGPPSSGDGKPCTICPAEAKEVP